MENRIGELEGSLDSKKMEMQRDLSIRDNNLGELTTRIEAQEKQLVDRVDELDRRERETLRRIRGDA